MLLVLSRGMLLQSDQVRACSMRQRTPLLTTKQPQLFSDLDLAETCARSAPCISVLSRGMLLQSDQARACWIFLRTAVAHNQATGFIFGHGYVC